jgi:uncharacterized SAM-binding protein YcdF (DUF218 family)
MFYYLSKIAWFFATPSNLLPSLILVGLLAMSTRFVRAGRRLALAGVLGLFAAGLLPTANWVIAPLQERFPVFRDDGRPVDGVIVLGGAIDAEDSFGRGQLEVNEAGDRVIAMADLARRYPEAKILFSGGGSTLLVEETPEAAALARFIETLGVAKDRVIFEDRSRTTYENAVFSRELAQPKPGERWLLVTSAWHMPRSIGCFRRAGFPVTAYPVDFRTRDARDSRTFAFLSLGLRRLDLAAKEWAGLLGYRLAGYTDALLPAPEPSAGSAIR